MTGLEGPGDFQSGSVRVFSAPLVLRHPPCCLTVSVKGQVRLTDGGEVRFMLRPPFTPRKIPDTHFFRVFVDPMTIVRLER
jgi:hypothetical protein